MVVCAWCNRQIAPRAPKAHGTSHGHAVSHGMCHTCLQERIGQVNGPARAA